jgi:hypothetical protein
MYVFIYVFLFICLPLLQVTDFYSDQTDTTKMPPLEKVITKRCEKHQFTHTAKITVSKLKILSVACKQLSSEPTYGL